MFRSGWDTLPNVREWSGVSPRCLAMVWSPSRLSGSGQKALPDDRDWYGGIPDVREWLKGYPECLGVVGGPPRYPGVVDRPSRTFRRPARRFGNGRETLLDVPIGWVALPDVRKLSVALPDVRRPFQSSRSGRVALPDI